MQSSYLNSRRGSVALALLIVMMLLIGLALQGMVGNATTQHRRESQHLQMKRLENALSSVIPVADQVDWPIRLPISETPLVWIEVTQDGQNATLRATEVRDGQEWKSLARSLPSN